MKVTVTTYLNRRLNTPQTLPDNKSGYLSPGDVIEVADVLQGQMIEGVDTWLKSADGNFFWSGGTNYNTLTNYAARIVNMPQAWKDSQGKGITIALLDTGISPSHPFLKAAFSKYQNLAYAVPPLATADKSGHGTAMAGLMAGTVPAADIISIKVLTDDNISTGQNLAQGLDKVIELLPQVKPDIINLSLDISKKQYNEVNYTNNETIETKINKLAATGIVIVSAAGDRDKIFGNVINYPAINSNIISVGTLLADDIGRTVNPRVDLLFYNANLQAASIDGSFTATTSSTSAYTSLISSLAAAILAAETIPAGKTKKDYVLGRIKDIAANISILVPPNGTEITIYKTT
ncbi:MAG: S8 family peptidase [Bacteroidota bacterium]